LDIKLEALVKKRHRLHVFTAEIDGKPTPEPPVIGKISLDIAAGDISKKRLNESATTSPGAEKQNSRFVLVDALERTSTMNSLPRTAAANFIVLYDFEAAPNTSELAVRKDEILSVVEVKDDG
jgi:hypothetical protein